MDILQRYTTGLFWSSLTTPCSYFRRSDIDPLFLTKIKTQTEIERPRPTNKLMNPRDEKNVACPTIVDFLF